MVRRRRRQAPAREFGRRWPVLKENGIVMLAGKEAALVGEKCLLAGSTHDSAAIIVENRALPLFAQHNNAPEETGRSITCALLCAARRRTIAMCCAVILTRAWLAMS